MNPELKKKLDDIIFKMIELEKSDSDIAEAVQLFYKINGLELPAELSSATQQPGTDSTSEATAMGDTLTGDVEADVISSGANIAHPDFWEAQETNPNDWVKTASGGYRNEVTGDIMEQGSWLLGGEKQRLLWDELQLNERLKENIVSNAEINKEQDVINEYWNQHSSKNPDVKAKDAVNRDDYTVREVDGDFEVTYSGDVVKEDARFMDESKREKYLRGPVVSEDDPVHGETVKILKQEATLNKNKEDKKKKEDREKALESSPTVSSALKEWDNKTDEEKGELHAQRDWFDKFKVKALEFGFKIEGEYNHNYPTKTYFKITHARTRESIEGNFFQAPREADAFMRKFVEGKQSVVRTLMDSAEAELEGTANERAANAEKEVKYYTDQVKAVEEQLAGIENISDEEVNADIAKQKSVHRRAIESYTTYLKNNDSTKHNEFIRNGSRIQDVPTKFISDLGQSVEERLALTVPFDRENVLKDFQDLSEHGYLAKNKPTLWRKVLLMTESERRKFLLEDYQNNFLKAFEEEPGDGILEGVKKAHLGASEKATQRTFRHIKNAKLNVAVERYIQQAGITDKEEIDAIYYTVFADHFKLENLDQFSKNVDTEDGFTTVSLDTIYSDVDSGSADVLNRATNSLHSAKDREALVKNVEAQVRKMDFSTWTKGSVQEVIGEEIDIDLAKFTEKEAELVEKNKIVNDKYADNREQLEVNINAREEVVASLNKIAGGEYKTQEELDKAQKKLDVLKTEYDELTSEIQKGLNTNTLLFSAASKMDEEFKEAGLELDNVELWSKYINQNFAPGTRMLWNAVSATADVVESGVEFVGMVGDANEEAQSWVLKTIGVDNEVVEAWGAINDYLPGFSINIPKSSRDQFHSWVDNWQEGVESGLGRSVAFDDINGIGDFGNWFGAMFASQIPNLALMASTGGASLYIMGATAAGGKYKDLREQDELYESSGGLYGNDYTFNQMFSTSILTGAAEALSERITLGQVDIAKGMWKGMTKEGLQKALKPGFGDFLLKNVVSKQGLKKGFIDTMEEGGSEVVATMAENITSRYILGNKDVHILDGGLESFVSGALISRTIGAFGIAGQAVNTFADPSVQAEKNAYIERQRSIMYSLSGRMGGGDGLISTGRPGGGGGENVEISREEKEELELELAENQIKLDELVELDIQRVDIMEDADKAEMIKLEKEQVRDALEWETADDVRREELLDKLEKRTKVKQEIIDKYPPEETKAAYAESMERARAKVALAKKAGKKIEIEEGGKERAVEWIKEMKALGMKVDTSEGIDGSFYGATAEIKTKDEAGKDITKTVIFVNKETILKDGMVQTAAHEFMHATLYNTVMQDPGVREVLGGELSKILKGKGVKISEKARLDLQRLNSYSAQEVGEELFAIVAEHMVSGDITIDDNTVGKFKDMIRRIWQNIFGYDINFDTTDDVREFMKNYARNIKGVGRPDNKINKAIEGMLTKAVGGKLVEKGKALKPNQRSKEKMKVDFSKARDNHIDLNPEQARQNKKNFDKLTQNEDGTKKWSSKEEWDSSAEKWEAFSLIDNSNTFIDNLIMSGMVFGEGYIRSEQDKRDFIKQVKEHLQDRLVGGMKKTATKQIDAIKDKQRNGEITAKETAEQIEKIENNRDNYRRGFDPTQANGSLFGWMTGGSGNALESTMYRARGDVMNEWKRDPNRNILSLDAPIGEGGETFGSRLEGKADPSAGVDADSRIDPDDLTKVWEDLEFNPETVASIQTSISRSNIDISDTRGFAGAKQETVGVDNVPILKNGKPVLNKKGKPKTKTPSKVSDVKFSGRASGVLKAVASEFGVDHRKVPTGITLVPKERAAILDRILANPMAILKNMPDQHTRSGKAVGVQNVLLNALFEEAGYRGGTKAATAMGDVGMDPQGIGIWNKKDGLNEVMLMEALGVEGAIQNGQFVETGRFDPKSTKFDSILKAVVSQTATLASNQQLRVQAIKNKSHPTDVIAEFGDGKNQLSFSKKAPVKFKGDPALIHGLVEFMRDNPNLKLNPKQAAIAYAGQLGLSATSGLANAAEVIQDAIDNPEFDYSKDVTLLVEALGKGIRTLDAVYAKGWGDWLTKLGFPENFLFDKTNINDRADYHVQTMKWLQTLPTAALDNQMAVKMVLQSGTKGDFYRNAGEVDTIIKAEKKRRKSLGEKFVEPKTNINWDKVKFDSNLMKKLENVTDKYAGVKDREKRVKLITRDAKAVIAKSTSNSVENNKALDEVMEGFNAFVNEKGITEVEKTQRQRFVATTLQDQTSRTAGLIRGAAAFNAISMTPGKLHYKTVSSKKRRELARKLGIIDSSNKIDDSDGDGKKIGSIIAGADSSLSIKEKERLQSKINEALKEFARENGIKVEEAQQQLFDEVNEVKTRHGEHDVALMLFTTTVFESMTKNTFKDKYPIARKFYSQTALNEDLRVEVDKAWGKTGNAPGWYMGMPGYLRFVVHNPEAARDIIDLETETTLDKVIAADIALNNLAGKYAPIVEGAREVMGSSTINKLPKVLNNIDTRIAFNELISEIAKSVYNETDLVNAEALAINLVTQLDNIKNINNIRKLIAKNSKLISPDMSLKEMREVGVALERTISFSRKGTEGSKGITVLDFDDTLATTKSNVLYTAPDGTTGKLNAEEFAKKGGDLLAQGVEFDFSEFNKVVDGKTAPLFNKAMKLASKFGTENMFILTARSPESQLAIKQFLDAQGLSIPLKNITGLGRSEASAKANWIAEKIGEGYNDFYFADDAIQNVEAVKDMLDQFDVKGKVQQAKVSFSKKAPKRMSEIIDEGGIDLNSDLNVILEQTKGVDRNKEFSAAKARKRGKNKGRFKFFVPPSADDFAGLMYAFMGKGKQGEQHHEFFKKNLFDPFSKGIRQLNKVKQSVANDLRQLRKAMPDVKKKLGKKIAGTEYTHEDAVRVYNWDKAGFDIPGLSNTDKEALVKAVENDAQLQAFAQGVNSISNTPGGTVNPGNDWLGGTINSDVNEVLESARAAHLRQWIENKNVIFSEANLNKIEAVYGAKFREALEDSLWRMEHGGTRSRGKDRLLNNWMTWLHGSVGATMFFNARSAVLQQLSNVNFLNWNDNNPIKAAKAFANQKQYWADFVMIFNSPWLKQRRSGIATDVNATELLNAMKDSKNPTKTAIAYLLRLGFTPTQIGDSLAIATGGAAMYRNRVNTYVDQGMSKAEAEAKAFEDMMEVAEETQQSTREDKISQQQASPLGKFVLAFQNVTMQYNRIMKKATLDLVNGRGDPKANISKIIYYGAVQNMIFYGLQQALFAAMFSDDEEDQLTEGKKVKLANGMLDSVLRGSGMHGAVIATVKNVIIKFMKEKEKMDDDKFFTDPDWANVLVEGLNVSPPIGIKARKIHSALKTWEYNDDVIRHMDKTDMDNPMWEGIFNVTEAITNAPLHRAHNKTMNIRESLDADNEAWKRIAMFMGWSRWSFGIENQDVVTAKGEVKEIKAAETEERREMKKRAKEAERQAEEEAVIESNLLEQDEERAEGKDEIKCAAVSRSGSRCSNKVKGGGNFCTIHEDAPQRADGKKTQCSHVKGDGSRCKMKTTNKSGKCYYHD
jgi:hypothetical protein